MACKILAMPETHEATKTFADQNEDELKTLAGAIAESKGGDIAGAATALLVKALTGSSSAASGAEKAVAKVFGQWLADNPDARLVAAAKALQAQDQERAALRRFAALVEPMVSYGLRSTEAALARVESGQRNVQRVGQRLLVRQTDLEDLLGQSLHATALVHSGQDEIKALLTHLQASLPAVKTDAVQQKKPSGALSVWMERLAYLEEQDAWLVDPAAKFRNKKLIEEAQAKIQELGGRG